MGIEKFFRPQKESLKNQVWGEGWQGISIDNPEGGLFEVSTITPLDRPLLGYPDSIAILKNSYNDREEKYILDQVYFSEYGEGYWYDGNCVKYAIFNVPKSTLMIKSVDPDGKDSYAHFRLDYPPIITYVSLENASAKPIIIDLREKLREVELLIDQFTA